MLDNGLSMGMMGMMGKEVSKGKLSRDNGLSKDNGLRKDNGQGQWQGQSWKNKAKNQAASWRGFTRCHTCSSWTYAGWLHGCRNAACSDHPSNRWNEYCKANNVQDPQAAPPADGAGDGGAAPSGHATPPSNLAAPSDGQTDAASPAPADGADGHGSPADVPAAGGGAAAGGGDGGLAVPEPKRAPRKDKGKKIPRIQR